MRTKNWSMAAFAGKNRWMNHLLALLGLFTLLSVGSASNASIIYSLSGGSVGSVSFAGTYGFTFVPVTNITVTSLGYFDFGEDGLASAHSAAIWDSNGTLVTSTSISTASSALAGAVFDGGQFRFTSIAPVTLNAGATYTFGANNDNYVDPWPYGGTTIANASTLASVSSIGYYVLSPSTDPTLTIGNTYGIGSFTANSVPEPASLTLIAGAVFTVFGRRHRVGSVRTMHP